MLDRWNVPKTGYLSHGDEASCFVAMGHMARFPRETAMQPQKDVCEGSPPTHPFFKFPNLFFYGCDGNRHALEARILLRANEIKRVANVVLSWAYENIRNTNVKYQEQLSRSCNNMLG